MGKQSIKTPKTDSTAAQPSKPSQKKPAPLKEAAPPALPPPATEQESSDDSEETDEQASSGDDDATEGTTATLTGADTSQEAGKAGKTGENKVVGRAAPPGINTPEESAASDLESSVYTALSIPQSSQSYSRKRKHSVMEFEAPTSALISSAHSFLKDTPKLEGSHDFQPWLSDMTTAIQIINCLVVIESDTPPGGTARTAANVNRAWQSAQAAVKGLILSHVGREARKSIQSRTTGFQMLDELKNRFTRKGGSRVAEIHASLRSTTLETSTDIHDFAAKLRTFNDELAAIHQDYALRKWEMNLHFVDNLTDAYDSFTTGLLTADNDFIEIGSEMDWQTLVNKAAEVEAKAKARGARATTSAYKASLESQCSHPHQHQHHQQSNTQALATMTSAPKVALDNARKALAAAKANAYCNGCEMPGHTDEECWKQGNAPMPEHVKKRKAAEQKRKEAAKKAKPSEVPAHAGFVTDEDEPLWACMAVLDERVDAMDAYEIKNLPPKSTSKGYHHYIDSGAGRHLSGQQESFRSLTKLERPITVSGFAGKRLVTYKGDMKVSIRVQGKPRTLLITDVLYVPGLPFSLLSVKAFARKGLRSIFDEDLCQIVRKDSNVLVAVAESLTETDLYRLVLSNDTPSGTHFEAYHAGVQGPASPSPSPEALGQKPIHPGPSASHSDTDPKPKEIDINVAHQRLGHLSEGHLRRLFSVSTGLHVKGTFKFCEECALAKQTRRNFTKQPTRTTTRLGRLHMDLSGPHPISVRGERYFLLLLDEATRKRWVYFLKQKSDVPGAIRQFLVQMETQTGLKVKRWHSDNGGEFISKVMEDMAKENGIIHEPTAAYNPEQNGSAERSMYTIWDGARALFKDTDLDINLWPEMVRTKIYLLNRSPTNALKGTTPFQAWEDTLPDLSHLRVLGSLGYKTTPRALLKTRDDRSEKCILLGYQGTNQYRVYNINKKRVETVRDVRFREDDHRPTDKIVPDISANHDAPAQPEAVPQAHHGVKRSRDDDPIHDGPSKRTRSKGPWDQEIFTENQLQPEPEASGLLQEIQATIARLHSQDRDPAMSISALLASVEAYQSIAEEVLRDPIDTDPYEPTNYKKAKASPHFQQWDTAMNEELKSLAENDTWLLVPRPPHRKVLGGKWVYKLKRGPGGEIQRYKARWVVRGFEQRYGIDFNETFAAVVKPMTYKALFAIAAREDWEIEQLDVKTAFLYGYLDEEVYVEMPAGHEEEGKVCKLNKALYGLKQAPRVWFKTLTEFLQSLGYHAIPEDPSVYRNKDNGTYVAIYVDDLLIFGPNKPAIATLKKNLSDRFHMSDLGPVAYYLGLEVHRDRTNRTIRLSQKTYLDKILLDLNMRDLRGTQLPMDPNLVLEPAPEGYLAVESLKQRYQSAVGSLMYLMLGTRPDIAFAVSQVSRFAANPTDDHWTAVQRIFRYLKQNSTLGLTYGTEELLGYTDANWARDNDRKSTGGYLYKLGGAAISWSSKRQNTIALSSCEAEYMAASEAAKEALWMRRLLNEFGYQGPQQVTIQADNKSAISLAENPMHHGRTKHIEIRYHFIREKVSEGLIKLTFVPTKEEAADGLTKPLGGEAFTKFIRDLGLS